MKIAMAARNPSALDGVQLAFNELYPKEEVKVYYYNMPKIPKNRELIEGEVIKYVDQKMKELHKKVDDEEIDIFVVVEGGLFSYSGNWFFSQVASVQKINTRGDKKGISAGLQIPEGRLLDVVTNGIRSLITDAEFVVHTHLKYSFNSFVKEAVQLAMSSYNW